MTFQTGTSGNPNGRPKGTGHRQKIFNELVLPHKEALINKSIEMALSGNEQMLRLLLERILPAKPEQEPITGIEVNNGTFTEQVQTILTLMLEGALPLREGKLLLDGILVKTKVVEIDELTSRIEKLEQSRAK